MSNDQKDISLGDRGRSRKPGVHDVDTKKRELIALFLFLFIERVEYLCEFSACDVLVWFKISTLDPEILGKSVDVQHV